MADNTSSRQGDSAIPNWLEKAYAERAIQRFLDVDGVSISYRVWREELHDTVLLVHGGAASSHWWDHLAPLLPRNRRIVAIDLSGHGDSDFRDAYDVPSWGREVVSVAQLFGGTESVVLIGHSMGGKVSVEAQRHAAFAGLILLDSPFRERGSPEAAGREKRAGGTSRKYASQQQAVEHYKIGGLRAPVIPHLMRHVAQTAVRETAEGWTWRFDRGVFAFPDVTVDRLEPLTCPAVLLRSELGFITDVLMEGMRARLGNSLRVMEIPQAGHHGLLDQPLAVLTALLGILTAWEWLPRR